MTWGFGKVILLGEHAVVYGHPAVAGSLARRVHCAVEPSDAGLRLRVPAWNLEVSADDDHPVASALRAIADACPGPRPEVTLVATADLPAGAGLGSSAALSVALARAITGAANTPVDDAHIERIADAGERCFHENPSGVDVALATRGGLGVFRRGEGLIPIDAAPVSLVIGLSGQPRRTADMVASVARQRDANREATDRHLDALGTAARESVAWLEQAHLGRVGTAMTGAHQHLGALGVSTARLDHMVRAALDAGALGAKLTGGGGGGAVIALAPGNEAAVEEAWRMLDTEAFTCLCGVTT